MADENAVDRILRETYGAPDTLGGDTPAPMPVGHQPYDMYGETVRPPEQLGQHNLLTSIPGAVHNILSGFGDRAYTATDRYMRGLGSQQDAALAYLEGLGGAGMIGGTRAAPLTGHTIGSLGIPRVPRVRDELGFYSPLDEAVQGWNRQAGTAADLRKWLSSQGVTDNEMEARGLMPLLADPRQSLTRQGVLAHLADHQMPLQQRVYAAPADYIVNIDTGAHVAGPFRTESDARWHLSQMANNERLGVAFERPERTHGALQYGSSQYTLNPNATSQERVLSLPWHDPAALARWRQLRREIETIYDAPGLSIDRMPKPELENLDRLVQERNQLQVPWNGPGLPSQVGAFYDGHFGGIIPNPIGWIRSSIQQADPGATMLWDELQMPWAQRIRDEGGRNDSNIVALRGRVAEAEAEGNAALARAVDYLRPRQPGFAEITDNPTTWHPEVANLRSFTMASDRLRQDGSPRAQALLGQLTMARQEGMRLRAELATANTAAAGHPLVNDTTQSLRTLMHYGLMDPRLADVQGIAITPASIQNARYPGLTAGAQALRYNPGTGELWYATPGVSRDQRLLYHHWRRKVTPDELPSVVGPDVARRLLASEPRLGHTHELTGLDIEIGGHGMRANYDQMYPDLLESIMRRLDRNYPGRQQVLLRRLPDMDDANTLFHYFPLTPAVREAIAQGLPPFKHGGAVRELLERTYG